MRIMFVSPNRESLPDPVVPLGLLHVMARVAQEHECSLVDLCFASDPHRRLEGELRRIQPDLVAVGMRNIQNATHSGTSDTIAYYQSIMARIRRDTDAPVVMGGAGFSVMPAEIMQACRPDYGISGEGEEAFAELVHLLAQYPAPAGERLRGIAGLHYFEGERCVHNARRYMQLDAVPRLDRSLVDPAYYAEHGTDAVQTKRGCPLHCSYCTYPLIEGAQHRLRAPSAVANELEEVRDRGAQHVFVVDSTFNLPRGHARAVCDELIRRGSTLPWTCYVNPLGFDRDLAAAMRRAGCVGFEVGSDSGRDHVLNTLRKGFTTEHIVRLHHIAQAEGLKDCHTFLLGTPTETLEDVDATLAFIHALQPFAAILMFWVDDREAFDLDYRRERSELRARIAEKLGPLRSLPSHWIVPPLGHRFDRKLFSKLRARGLKGPLWQHLPARARTAT